MTTLKSRPILLTGVPQGPLRLARCTHTAYPKSICHLEPSQAPLLRPRAQRRRHAGTVEPRRPPFPVASVCGGWAPREHPARRPLAVQRARLPRSACPASAGRGRTGFASLGRGPRARPGRWPPEERPCLGEPTQTSARLPSLLLLRGQTHFFFAILEDAGLIYMTVLLNRSYLLVHPPPGNEPVPARSCDQDRDLAP